MSAVLAVEDVTFDGIILRGKTLVDVVELVCLDELVGDDNVILGAEVDALLRRERSRYRKSAAKSAANGILSMTQILLII